MLKETNRIPIIYCRVSSDRQMRDGGGLESQEQRCRSFCVLRGYGEPVMVFKDSFTGGGDFMRRPAMKELLDYIIARPDKDYVVVFDDLKRFARDVVRHWELRTLFSKLNVLLLSPNFEFKDDDEEGWLNETVNATFNEYDRRTNRRQVIQKQEARLRRGYWAFHAPKGYTMQKTEDGNLCMPNEKGLVLKEGLEGFAYKRFTKQIDLARFLQEKGFFSKKCTAEKYLETTKKLLLNSFYAGYIENELRKVERLKGKHQAIISEEVYNANIKRINGEAKTGILRQDLRDDFALRGLVSCIGCGNSLTAYYSKSKTGKKHPYYSCQSKKCLLRSKTIQKKIIDDGFKKEVSKNIPKKELIDITTEMFDDLWKDEMAGVNTKDINLEVKKEKLEMEIRKFADEVIDTDNQIVKNQYRKRIEEKTNEVEEIDSVLNKKLEYKIPYRTSCEKITGMIKTPYKIWEKGTVEQKQELFSFMFDDRIVYEHKVGYRTPEKSCLYKLFDQLEGGHTYDVEMAGIEPACKGNSYISLHVCYVQFGLNIYSRGHTGKINTELLIVGIYIKLL